MPEAVPPRPGKGPVPELAAFFKEPMDTEQRAFGAQMDMLRALARELCRT